MNIDFSPRELGRAAADACLAKAMRQTLFDPSKVADFILAELHINGPKSGERLTDAAKAAGFVPHSDKSFGPIYAGLSRRGLIRCVDTCSRNKGHGTAGGLVWDVTR